MSEEGNDKIEAAAVEESPSSESKHSAEMSQEKIKEFEEELIRLGEEAASYEKIEDNHEEEKVAGGYPDDAERIIELGDNHEELPLSNEEAEEEVGEAPEGNKDESPDDFNILKNYQNTLQELKEEISKLNKQIDYKERQAPPNPSEKDLFKIQCLCKYAKAEVKSLASKAEELSLLNQQKSENLEVLKAESSKNVSSEKVNNLKEKLKQLEKEYDELTKTNEINIADFDKIISPDANQKLVNEFNVNLQKRIGYLDIENTKLTSAVKKSNNELLKLKEKVDNADHRHKLNEDLKNKLKNSEDTLKKYEITEEKLRENLKQAYEEYSIYSSRPENQHDADSARNILKDMRDQVYKEEVELENLEFVLQEKKNMLRAAQVYGLQRSKTSNKLRTDMELLGLVLVEKEKEISRLKKEIDEFRIKTNQTQIDIKELLDKKNKAY